MGVGNGAWGRRSGKGRRKWESSQAALVSSRASFPLCLGCLGQYTYIVDTQRWRKIFVLSRRLLSLMARGGAGVEEAMTRRGRKVIVLAYAAYHRVQDYRNKIEMPLTIES